jgi:hypothetical protein
MANRRFPYTAQRMPGMNSPLKPTHKLLCALLSLTMVSPSALAQYQFRVPLKAPNPGAPGAAELVAVPSVVALGGLEVGLQQLLQTPPTLA